MRHEKPMTAYSQLSRARLIAARKIADDLRHNPAFHKLAMKAVFVLEDCHKALTRVENDANNASQTGKDPKSS